MTGLPPSASVANPLEGSKLLAPSALRNLSIIVKLVQSVAPVKGRALEIASGTGQHICALATALPHIQWHPSEIAADRIASIDAYAGEADLNNLHPARMLDAATPDWAQDHGPYDLIYMGNLLHLIPQDTANAILMNIAQALVPDGTCVLYGPFLRDGIATSEGDAKFDAELRAADPAIGYKDDRWMHATLQRAGLSDIRIQSMPANNLAFIAQREPTP